MTTEADNFRIDVAANLFEPNECINLPHIQNADVVPQLGCITISQSVGQQHREDVMWTCAGHAWKSLLSGIDIWTCWLFACVCGEDNRIMRHQGLWKMLAGQGLAPASQLTPETLITKDGGLCIYGATGTDGGAMSLFRPVVRPGSRSFLTLLPRAERPAVDLAIAMGWQRGLSDLNELRDMALVVSKQGGVVLRLFGEFDDSEAGVDCITGAGVFQKTVALLRE